MSPGLRCLASLFATIAATGIRRGEAVGAIWAGVDLKTGFLEIRQTITKAGSKIVVKEPKSKRSRRLVPLPPAVVALLGEHRIRQTERRLALGSDWQDHDLVFPNEWGRFRYPDYVSTKFATYARQCGLPHIGGPHGLRHSLASALDASGNGLATISTLLGHASTAVTSKVYTHMLKGADRAAVDEHAASLFSDIGHDVGQQRRERRALWGALRARLPNPVGHHPCLQVAMDELEQPLVGHPT